MICYYKLWKYLQKQGINNTCLKTDGIVNGSSYTKLRNNEIITMKTINSICEYLHCQPGDILEWIPDDEINKQVKGDSNEQ